MRTIADEPIDVALLDSNLGPGQTSAPLALRLRRCGVPIVFLSAYQRGQIAGAMPQDIVLSKPSSLAQLCQALARARLI